MPDIASSGEISRLGKRNICASRREGEEGEEEGEAFHELKGLKRLKGLKEFKVERVKGKVAERGGG